MALCLSGEEYKIKSEDYRTIQWRGAIMFAKEETQLANFKSENRGTYQVRDILETPCLFPISIDGQWLFS